MRAFICDACGEVYKPYGFIDDYGEGNMITVVKTERDGKMHGKMRLELCPSCMVKTYDYIANELVAVGSPAYERYYVGNCEEPNDEANSAPNKEASEEEDPYTIS